MTTPEEARSELTADELADLADSLAISVEELEQRVARAAETMRSARPSDRGRVSTTPMGPRTVANEQEAVLRWAEALAREIRELERREEQPSDRWAAAELVEALARRDANQALLEVVSRGVDPKFPRRLRGRIVLTIRCRPRGHALGYVYPTSTYPVFIPTVSSGRTYGSRPTIRRGGPPGSDTRDQWIERLEGRTDDEETSQVNGAVVLDPGYLDLERRAADEADRADRYGRDPIPVEQLAWGLTCRCGVRWVYLRTLRDTLLAGCELLTV